MYQASIYGKKAKKTTPHLLRLVHRPLQYNSKLAILARKEQSFLDWLLCGRDGGAGSDCVSWVRDTGGRGNGEPYHGPGRFAGGFQVGCAAAVLHVQRYRPGGVPLQPLVRRRRRLRDVLWLRPQAVPQLRRLRHRPAAPGAARRPAAEAAHRARAGRRLQLISISPWR
jgi:hypothetical protein